MKNKFLVVIVLFFYISITFAQSSLNAYKYIIIPKKYDFLKEDDKYQLNSLTKFLFDKKGYQTVEQNREYPSDLVENPCLAVTVEVNDISRMFISKLIIELKNCYNKIIFTSEVGRSKEKDFKKSYHEALRKAFVTIEQLDYNFDPSLVVNSSVAPSTSDLEVEKPKVILATPVVTTDTHVNVSSMTKSYKNDMISFFLIEQNNGLVAYINTSEEDTFKKGEKIGILKKTSRPDVYRISWKNKEGNFENTMGYFDEKGNLSIDIEKDGEVDVIVFEVEN